MQDRQLFEYALIRVVPKVEREEFLNVGIILYCRDRCFLGTKFTVDERKLKTLSEKLDIEEVRKHLQAFRQICAGDPSGGPIALLDIAARFRWLTATRSTVVQASRVHPGLCLDPQETLDELHRAMVL